MMGPETIRKIGITGGIASGKSRVAEKLAELLGCERIDADEIARTLLEPHQEGWQEFTRVFGSEYLDEDEWIDRSHLRRDLFVDSEFRDKVNSVIHPVVKKKILARMNQVLAASDKARVLVEVPLLYEAGWDDMFDTVVVVYADYETCLARLMDRDDSEREVAKREMESQLDLGEKAIMADHVIDNSSMFHETVAQVEHLAQLLRNKE